MNYWILKTEPDAYSWDNLVKDGSTSWTGIRNFQARNNLKKMALGDQCFIYHSGEERQIIGLAEVTKAAYPDPSDKDMEWFAVDIKAVKELNKPLTLAELQNKPGLHDLVLIRQARLSVSPVTEAEATIILKMSGV